MAKQPKKKPTTIELRFDSEDDAHAFVASWLAGGGEQRCQFDTLIAESDDWTKRVPKWLKLKFYGEEE